MQEPIQLNYIKGLNGVRALSALLVISTHWPSNFLSIKFGWIGVNIFFVLSGFLITRILLVERQQKNLISYLGNFYFKRSLRIFPLYYAFIMLIAALIWGASILSPSLLAIGTWKSGYYAVIKDLPYYMTYTYNLKINFRYLLDLADYPNHFLGHLWSLAVEEQFYLVFPFVVYFASLENLKRIIITIIVVCPLFRLWAALFGVHIFQDGYWLGEFIYSNTLCQADALATGAALAIFRFKVRKPYLLFVSTAAVWLVVGLLHLYFLRKSGYFLVEGKSFGFNFPGFWYMQPTKYIWLNIRASYLYTLVNFFAVTLILPAIHGRPLFPRLFEQRHFAYLGKISYGVYLFHYPLIGFMIVILDFYGGIQRFSVSPVLELASFLMYMVVLLGLAHLSFQYFEKRILVYKTRVKTSKHS